jgi:hypothetical protein
MARRRKYGVSFSWKRALGISSTKQRLSRKIGVPLTRSGRQKAMGRALGCSVIIGIIIIGTSIAGIVVYKIL